MFETWSEIGAFIVCAIFMAAVYVTTRKVS